MREVACLVFVLALMLLPDLILGTLVYTFRRVFGATARPASSLPTASVVVGPLGELSRSAQQRVRRWAVLVGRVSLAAAAAILASLIAVSAVIALGVLSLP